MEFIKKGEYYTNSDMNNNKKRSSYNNKMKINNFNNSNNQNQYQNQYQQYQHQNQQYQNQQYQHQQYKNQNQQRGQKYNSNRGGFQRKSSHNYENNNNNYYKQRDEYEQNQIQSTEREKIKIRNSSESPKRRDRSISSDRERERERDRIRSRSRSRSNSHSRERSRSRERSGSRERSRSRGRSRSKSHDRKEKLDEEGEEVKKRKRSPSSDNEVVVWDDLDDESSSNRDEDKHKQKDRKEEKKELKSDLDSNLNLNLDLDLEIDSNFFLDYLIKDVKLPFFEDKKFSDSLDNLKRDFRTLLLKHIPLENTLGENNLKLFLNYIKNLFFTSQIESVSEFLKLFDIINEDSKLFESTKIKDLYFGKKSNSNNEHLTKLGKSFIYLLDNCDITLVKDETPLDFGGISDFFNVPEENRERVIKMLALENFFEIFKLLKTKFDLNLVEIFFDFENSPNDNPHWGDLFSIESKNLKFIDMLFKNQEFTKFIQMEHFKYINSEFIQGLFKDINAHKGFFITIFRKDYRLFWIVIYLLICTTKEEIKN